MPSKSSRSASVASAASGPTSSLLIDLHDSDHETKRNSIQPPIKPNEALVEHNEFYINDEMIILRVENTYFRVHQYFLKRDSEIFRDMFLFPSGNKDPEGRTKETAIHLPGVNVHEVTCLLRFLYRGMYDNYGWKTTVPEWVALLSISTRYAFDRIRERAITALSPSTFISNVLDPTDMIVLATKHDVPQWLETAYVLLTMRDEPLEENEGERLGLGIVIRLARCRERYWKEQASMPEGRLEEDIRLGVPGHNTGWRPTSGLFGLRAPCPKRTRATQIVHEVFWPVPLNTPVDALAQAA